MPKTCAECRWWEKNRSDDNGICRFFPPVWKNLFPEINGECWCGQFAAREVDDDVDPAEADYAKAWLERLQKVEITVKTKPKRTSTAEEKIAEEMKRADAKSKDPWNETGEAYDKGRRDGLSFALETIHRTALPKRTRWMVAVSVAPEILDALKCRTCSAVYDNCKCVFTDNLIPDKGRDADCPAEEVECEDSRD